MSGIALGSRKNKKIMPRRTAALRAPFGPLQTGPSGSNTFFNHISNGRPNTTHANTRLGVSRAAAQQHAIAHVPLRFAEERTVTHAEH